MAESCSGSNKPRARAPSPVASTTNYRNDRTVNTRRLLTFLSLRRITSNRAFRATQAQSKGDATFPPGRGMHFDLKCRLEQKV